MRNAPRPLFAALILKYADYVDANGASSLILAWANICADATVDTHGPAAVNPQREAFGGQFGSAVFASSELKQKCTAMLRAAGCKLRHVRQGRKSFFGPH